MRSKKIRLIKCDPGERYFVPKGKAISKFEEINLTVDEFEAVRLSDLDGCTQEEVGRQMKVHRSTISRILESAHRKIADALVNSRAIKIEGGCCEFLK